MTLAIHHALRTSERATRATRSTQFIGRFQTAPRLRAVNPPLLLVLLVLLLIEYEQPRTPTALQGC